MRLVYDNVQYYLLRFSIVYNIEIHFHSGRNYYRESVVERELYPDFILL